MNLLQIVILIKGRNYTRISVKLHAVLHSWSSLGVYTTTKTHNFTYVSSPSVFHDTPSDTKLLAC